MACIYLAGPMTGLPEHNFPAFHAAAAVLRERGHQVVSPAEVNAADVGKWAWEQFMRVDLALLVKCERIAMLPGWQQSKGAKLEHHVATEIGMPVDFIDFL